MATQTPPRKGRRVRDESWMRTQAAFAKVLETMTPWLFDLGNWIFGALIAFSLVMLGALFTVGPVDRAILVATASFALALPFDVAGFVLLKFAADMKTIDFEGVTTRAFVDQGFDPAQVGVSADPKAAEKRRAQTVLRISYILLNVTLLVTVTGLAAALWHMSWWIGVLFAASAVVSLITIGAGVGGGRRPPSASGK